MKQKKTEERSSPQLAMDGFEKDPNARRISALSKGMKRNMTLQERKLYYSFFRQMEIPVVRQKVIGKYIVDFYVAPDLIVELDGSQHFSESGTERDCARDAYLSSQGYTVLRYANSDVTQHFEAVCEDILSHFKE